MPGRVRVRLRSIRFQGQLALREVVERSLRFGQERDNQSCHVSASWLDRLEREEHELTVNKLIALTDIYNLPIEQLLRSINPGDAQPMSLRQLSSPKVTMLLTEGSLDSGRFDCSNRHPEARHLGPRKTGRRSFSGRSSS
jgi:hypothetical protein